MTPRRTRLIAFLAGSLALALAAVPVEGRQSAGPTAQDRRLLAAVTQDGLKRHVDYLASDGLEGRATPSRGLDMAADYIASRFRASGLVGPVDDGFFQVASFETVTLPSAGLSLSIWADGAPLTVPRENLVHLSTGALALSRAGVFLVDLDNLAAAADQARGKVLVVDLAGVQTWTAEQRASRAAILKDPAAALAPLGGAALVFSRTKRDTLDAPQLREASRGPAPGQPPLVSVNDEAFRRLVATWKPGVVAASIALSVPAPVVVPVELKNVAGVLPGSDPSLRDTCVLVSAHYDHLGTRPGGDGDRVFNGANDNASGVAVMLEIARAIAESGAKPRRTILFLAFFGEEKSGMGAQWYVKHPIVPLARTVVNINLEQLGRIEDAEGTHPSSAVVTGIDYSDIGDAIARAGLVTGVSFAGRDGAKYFTKADNIFLARAGIPAHTVSATCDFPGRHTPSDEAAAIDYASLELLARAIGLAVWDLSSAALAPRWSGTNPEARPYREAWEKLTSVK